MIIVMSPAKTFHITTQPYETLPYFMDEARRFVGRLLVSTDETLADGMHISAHLLKIVKDDLKCFGETLQPAIHAYHGQAFKSFWDEPEHENTGSLTRNRLLILSALYGIVRPFDGISRYRLEMNHRFLGDLVSFWTPYVQHFIMSNHQNDEIVNLASFEYARLILTLPKVISIRFETISNDIRTSPSMMVKTMRGRMARAIIERQYQHPSDIKTMEVSGFTYDEHRSTAETYVFSRRIE